MGVAPQKQKVQMDLFATNKRAALVDDDYDVGFANPRIELSPDTLLTNIQNIQSLSNINESRTLSHIFGAVDLDVEMETGTGKTYVYINDVKATSIVEHVTYNEIGGNFDSQIFTEAKLTEDFKKAYKAEKHIRDFIFLDSAKEREFAEDLDGAEEVCVYAKLPKGFYIPTPMGNYSPDWAIAFKEGTVKHIYFIAETKGGLGLELRPVEDAKIQCAKKLFNKMSTSQVRYEAVTSYQDLLGKITKFDERG